MNKKSGGTNTAAALTKSGELLADAGQVQKYVYLFTDGNPDDQNAAKNAGEALRGQVRFKAFIIQYNNICVLQHIFTYNIFETNKI